MLGKMKEYVAEHRMFQHGDKVILGLSGGADSVCLFFALLELQEVYNLSLEAIHIHHGIRGIEADDDVIFVQTLCARHQIPVRVIYYDVPAMARKLRLSEEEAGRNIRYEEFKKLLEEKAAQKIAVAHHACDQAETILYHLCRGSGLRGLCGMRPVAGEIVRPLLDIQRTEIEVFLREKGITWRMDSSNLSDAYTRNRIRNQILPLLESEVNKKSVAHIVKSGDMFSEVYSYIRKQGKEAYQRIAIKEKTCTQLDEKLLQKEELIIQKEVIRMALEEYANGLKDIARIHVLSVLDLCAKPVGKTLSLPGNIRVAKTYDKLIIASIESAEDKREGNDSVIVLEPEKSYWIAESKIKLSLDFTSNCPFLEGKSPAEDSGEGNSKKFNQNEENSYTKWIDYDRIKGALQLRHRKEGDYIVLEGSGGRKKLKQYFIDEKVPRELRDSIWLLTDGNHVLWVLGYRLSADCKVTEETRRILRIRVMGVADYER